MRVVDRCLEKSVAARFQSAEDLAFALSSDAALSPSVGSVSHKPSRAARWVALAAALGTVLVVAGLARSFLARDTPEFGTYRLSVLPPADSTFAGAAPTSVLALSPDGRKVAFTATGSDGRRLLWLRMLDGASAQPVGGSEGASNPFWSPDSRFVGFMATGQIKKVDVNGGTPLTVCDAPGGLDGSWGQADTIVFSATISGRRVLWRVPAAGGAPTPATTLDTAAGDNRHTAPFFLPDGEHFLYLAIGSRDGGPNDPRAVYVGSLRPDVSPREVLQGGSNAKYANGHLLFLRDQTLMAQRFDLNRLGLTGDAVPVADRIATTSASGSVGAFSVSNNGLLAYLTAGEARSQLMWFDREGRRLATLGEPGSYDDVELSPGGTGVAVSVMDSVQRRRNIWVYEAARGVRTRLTFDPAEEWVSVWSPDTRQIVFSRRRESFDLYKIGSSGGRGEEQVSFDMAHNEHPSSWSPDGRFLLFVRTLVAGSSQRELWVQPMDGGSATKLADAPFSTGPGQFSPDGRFVAYESNESGRLEVYVVPFPNAGGKWQVSTGGGSWPRWRNMREILYLGADRQLIATSVTTSGTTLEVGRAHALFQLPAAVEADRRYQYDVADDSQRVLINVQIQGASSLMTVLVNWPALIPE
jgi:Tol biopolymer transport system component